MKEGDSVSVIIPALNEANYLEPTASTVVEAAREYFERYEILIFNDGSTDNTGDIAEKIANNYEFIRVVHNKRPVCLGSIYKQGRRLARNDYVILVNGKNDISAKELKKIFSLKGQADIVIPYAVNRNERPFKRRVFSWLFVALMNFLFGLDLKYYNHYVLHKREIINSIDINTDSYAFQAEALIKLIRMGYSYIEIGVEDDFSNDIKTKAFRVKNIFGVISFFCIAFWEVYFKKLYSRYRYIKRRW